MNRSIRLASTVLALVGLIVLAWLTRDSSRVADRSGARTQDASRTTRSAPAANLELDSTHAEPAGELAAPDGRAAGEPGRSPLAAAGENGVFGRVRGRVRLQPREGPWVEDADGSLTLTLWAGAESTAVIAQVTGGSFDVARPVGLDRVRVVRMEGGELNGQLVESGPASDPRPALSDGDYEFEVSAQVPQAVILDVRDAATGKSLHNVTLARGTGLAGVPGHPGPKPEHFAEGVSTPFDLTPLRVQGGLTPTELQARLSWDRQRFHVWARAPGYAWGDVELDLRGDRRLLLLEPGGSAAVRVVGVAGAEGLALHLHVPESGFRHVEPVAADAVVRLDGLPPGELAAEVLRGSWYSDSPVFGNAVGQIVAGSELDLRVDVDVRAQQQAAVHEVALEVQVPAGWDVEGPMLLSLQLLRSATGVKFRESISSTEPAPPVGGPQRFRFDPLELPAGDWRVQVVHLGVRLDMTVDGPGQQRLELPPVAHLTILLSDPNQGRPVDGARIRCSWRDDPNGRSVSSVNAAKGEQPGEYRARVPVGEVSLSAEHRDFGPGGAVRQVHAGQQVIALTLGHNTSLRLTLREGEYNTTPEGFDWIPFLRAAGQEERVRCSMKLGSNGLTLTGLDPGAYVLSFPEIPGYERIEDVELDLEEGDERELAVELVRVP